jgi:hypothetical protein
MNRPYGQRPAMIPGAMRQRRHTDRPGVERLGERPVSGLDEMNRRYRGPMSISPGTSKYAGIGSPRTKNNYPFNNNYGRTANLPLTDRLNAYERTSQFPDNTTSLHDAKLPNPYANPARGASPRYDPIRAGRPEPRAPYSGMHSSKDKFGNPKMFNSRAMNPKGSIVGKPDTSYRQRYGNNFSPSKQTLSPGNRKYGKGHESNKEPLRFHDPPKTPTSNYVPTGDDIIFGYDTVPEEPQTLKRQPTPQRQAAPPQRLAPKPAVPQNENKYVPSTDDFIFGYDDPSSLEQQPKAPPSQTIVNRARIVAPSPLQQQRHGYEKFNKTGGLTPVTYKQLKPGTLTQKYSRNPSANKSFQHSSSKTRSKPQFDLSGNRTGININMMRPGQSQAAMKRTPTTKKEFSTNKKPMYNQREVRPFSGGKPIEFVDSFSPSKYQETKRSVAEPIYTTSPYNTNASDRKLSESRDWSSRHAFKDVKVTPPTDRLRRYSYNGIDDSFYSRICKQEYKSGTAGRDFEKYMRACREELEMAFKANDFFYDKPLKINTVNLPKIKNSNFSLIIFFRKKDTVDRFR